MADRQEQSQSTEGAGSVIPLQLSYAPLGGSGVPAATRENVHVLQEAADFLFMQRSFRRWSYNAIGAGLISIGIGYWSYAKGSNRFAFDLVGFTLLGVGVWSVIAPSPRLMLIQSLVWLAAGIGYTLAAFGSPAQLHLFTYGVGSFFFAQALVSLVMCRRYWNVSDTAPSIATLKWLSDLRAATENSRPYQDPTAIEFANDRWSLPSSAGRGRLFPEIAAIVIFAPSGERAQSMHLASRDGIEILRDRPIRGDTAHRVRLRFNRKKINTVMPEQSLNRLKAWLAEGSLAAVD